MRLGNKEYRESMARLQEAGITINIVRVDAHRYELHKNYEIIGSFRKRETCNHQMLRLIQSLDIKSIKSLKPPRTIMFFQHLAELSPNMDLTLRLMMKGGKITVAVIPATDEDIKPLTVSGTALELDEGFIDTIRKPMELVSGLTSNAEEFMESVKKEDKPAAKKDTKSTKADSSKPSAKETKTETPEGKPSGKGVKADAPELKFHNTDRILFFNPGIHRGKQGTVINEQPNENGEIVVRFDNEDQDLPIAVKDLAMYKRNVDPAPEAKAPSQPELAPSQPEVKPAPPKPGPPKPAPAPATA